MSELPAKGFQFQENPKIKDIIKVLKQAEASGYTSVKPYIVEGDYKHETMDSEKLLRIFLF